MSAKTPRHKFDEPALNATGQIMDIAYEDQGQTNGQIKAKIQVLLIDLLQEDHAGTHAELARLEAERDAMESMVVMLEEKEWAEHASKGPVSSRLETCITTLMNELSEANERADEATVSGMTYAEQRDTAQAQLAEALGLLSAAVDYCYSSEAYEKGRAFLARYAQAEQQEAREPILVWGGRGGDIGDLVVVEHKEAQGAQAGEFWTWLDLAYRDGSKGEGRNFTKHNMEVAYRAGAEAARAALATQPAAGEPVAPIGYANPKHLARMSAGHMGSVSVLAERSPDENHTAPVFAAPPAAAHGDDVPGTVRVTADWLKKVHRDLDACQKVIWLAGCRPRVPGGFDPAYCEDAQARLKEIDEHIARAQAGEGGEV